MVPRVLRRLTATARYLALRARIARRYEASPLDDLLGSLDRAGPALDLRDSTFAIQNGERIARHAGIGPDTCLFRALARYALLRRAGHQPRFVMGVDASDPGIGHAWIELDGAPYLEPHLAPYRRTLEHP